MEEPGNMVELALDAGARARKLNRVEVRHAAVLHIRYTLFIHSLLWALSALGLRLPTLLSSLDPVPLLISLKRTAAMGDTVDVGMFCMGYHLE